MNNLLVAVSKPGSSRRVDVAIAFRMRGARRAMRGLSLASQPYFFLVRMRVREGGGGKEGKIRLVTNARFSFPVADFVTHQ